MAARKRLALRGAPQEVVGFLVGSEIFERDQHGRRLALVAGDDDGLVVLGDAVQRSREVLAEVAL